MFGARGESMREVGKAGVKCSSAAPLIFPLLPGVIATRRRMC